MKIPYKKQVKTTLKGELLIKLNTYMKEESMRESEAVKYFIAKGLKQFNQNQNDKK